MSKYYIPRDHFIRHVVIHDDTDESLAEETQKVTFILRLIALFLANNVHQVMHCLEIIAQKKMKNMISFLWTA